MPKYHISPAGEAAARKLTNEIKRAADNLWELLLEAWNSKAHVSLGYKSWNAYIDGEFDFGRQYSYRLINQGQVIKSLREAAEVSPMGDRLTVSEREARDVAPVIGDVVAEVREQVSAGVEPQEAVRVAVERVRAMPVTSGPFSSGFDHIADDDEPSTCVHEYVCRHCGELLA